MKWVDMCQHPYACHSKIGVDSYVQFWSEILLPTLLFGVGSIQFLWPLGLERVHVSFWLVLVLTLHFVIGHANQSLFRDTNRIKIILYSVE